MKRFHSRSRPNTDAGRNPAQRDLPFPWWEAVRGHTAARRQDLIARAELSPTLRRMLAALHSRCCGKRICWPSLATLAGDLGYAWPQAKRTMLRQIDNLKSLGLLWVEHSFRKDGSQSSSKYAIRYGALRNRVSRVELEECHRGVSGMSPGGVSSVTGGCQNWHRGVPILAPLELNGMELKRSETDDDRKLSVAGCPLPVGTAVGGEIRNRGDRPSGLSKTTPGRPEGLSPLTTDNRQPTTPAKRGSWTGHIGDLSDQAERSRIFQDAIRAGFVTDCPVDRVRFRAACVQARKRPEGMSSGWLVAVIEGRNWSRLDEKCVRQAFQQLAGQGLQLSEDRLKEILR